MMNTDMQDIWAILGNVSEALFAFDDQHPLLFTQFYFWAFFALVVLCLSAIGRSRILLRNSFLFFASLFFYYKTSGAFTVLLIFTTILSFFVGIKLGKYQGKENRTAIEKGWLTLGILLNMLILGYFKYAYLVSDMVSQLCGVQIEVHDYLAEMGNAIMGSEHFSIDFIWLPVGISFYTFQCISYLMDIYRNRIRPLTNVLNYGFYVSFFPQLVAGPIVRANEFVAQITRPYNLSRRWFGIALFWILNGLAKKIILADYLAVNFADRVFTNPTMYGGFENFSALFVYSLQVYADFSGYTDIAIGVALLMGFYLPRNFNSPYKATNCSEFWKRWHISLSKWLQDYLYISMGGNRRASLGTYIVIATIALVGTLLSGSLWVAIVVISIALVTIAVAIIRPSAKKEITSNVNRLNTMLLGGLWHGASWNFMIWGGLNGIGMLVFRAWHAIRLRTQAIVVSLLALGLIYLAVLTEAPLARMGAVCLSIVACVTLIRWIYELSRAPWKLSWLERVWAVGQTFTFVTFTRLFFRAGSNLNPAEANQVAWETATSMVAQIGSPWNTAQIPAILEAYSSVFLLFLFGMIIHWLPERTKRWYRVVFASLPMWLMAVVVVLVVLVIYQFVTADLQKFIYFQF